MQLIKVSAWYLPSKLLITYLAYSERSDAEALDQSLLLLLEVIGAAINDADAKSIGTKTKNFMMDFYNVELLICCKYITNEYFCK